MLLRLADRRVEASGEAEVAGVGGDKEFMLRPGVLTLSGRRKVPSRGDPLLAPLFPEREVPPSVEPKVDAEEGVLRPTQGFEGSKGWFRITVVKNQNRNFQGLPFTRRP